MSAFKPKPPPDELTAAFKTQLRDLPTAVVHQSQSEPPQEIRAGEGRLRKAPPVVQMNFNISEELADIISEEAKKAGSTRRWLARGDEGCWLSGSGCRSQSVYERAAAARFLSQLSVRPAGGGKALSVPAITREQRGAGAIKPEAGARSAGFTASSRTVLLAYLFMSNFLSH